MLQLPNILTGKSLGSQFRTPSRTQAESPLNTPTKRLREDSPVKPTGETDASIAGNTMTLMVKIEQMRAKSIQTELQTFASEIKISVTKAVQDSIKETIEGQIYPLQCELKECQKTLKIMKNLPPRQKELENKVLTLEKENENLKHSLHKMETYSRRNNIRLSGLKEGKDENCKTLIFNALKNVGTVLEQHDILVAHRVFSNGKECPILAQLSGPEIKRKIFGAKTLLRFNLGYSNRNSHCTKGS